MTTLELGESVRRWLVVTTIAWKLGVQRGGSDQARSSVAVWSLAIFGTGKGSTTVAGTRQLRQRPAASSLGKSFLHRSLHVQLGLLLVVLVDVLAQLLLLADNAGTSVAQY